jgi:DNA-binding NarL/FixJ family response regulator
MHEDRRLLVVAEDPVLLRRMRTELSGCEITVCSRVQCAVERLATEPVDVVITDLGLARGGAIAVLAWLRARHYPTGVVVVRREDRPSLEREAKGLGARVRIDPTAPLRDALLAAAPLG